MNSEKLKLMQDILKVAIPFTDSQPIGEFIPSNWQPPKGFVNKKFLVEEVPVEHLIPDNKETNCVILQFHGGGYVFANMDGSRDTTVKYSESAGGAEVFSVDYRVGPTHVYPAALEDAIKVYKWLLEKGYDNKNIVFAGDSAGGNLALALALYLRDNKMPLPKAIVTLSPWANPACDLPSFEYNYEKDLILGKYGSKVIAKELENPSYFVNVDVKKDPYASPVLGDYTGFPNMLITAGSHELLLDDAKVVAKRAEDAGVNVKLKIYDEMVHDFAVGFPMFEETEDHWREVGEFIKSNMQG